VIGTPLFVIGICDDVDMEMHPVPPSTVSTAAITPPSTAAISQLSRPVSGCTTLEFARMVWAVGAAARQAGLEVPGFVDAAPEVVRHVRRRPGRDPVVVIGVHGRSTHVVRLDVIEGVLAINRRADPDAVRRFLAELRAYESMPARAS
jgi:hypothetical protein